MAEKEKRKRKTLPPRGDPAAATTIPTRQRLGAELDEREDFGENTFAGALADVKHLLEKAGSDPRPGPPKSKKKG